MWALGASPDVLKSNHNRNVLNMRDAMKVAESLVEDLEDDSVFERSLGKEENFPSFEKFFQNQITQNGYQAVMQKYLVGRGPLAEKMHSHVHMGKYASNVICPTLVKGQLT